MSVRGSRSVSLGLYSSGVVRLLVYKFFILVVFACVCLCSVVSRVFLRLLAFLVCLCVLLSFVDFVLLFSLRCAIFVCFAF